MFKDQKESCNLWICLIKKTILVSNAYQIYTINKNKKVFLPNVDIFVLYLTFFCFLKQLE